ncbi:MAG: MATE family efflux transporter, partial [Lachnospiraceae bacterium]
ASDATLPYAVEYARIYIFGSIFVLIVLGMNLFITTQGFTKISMMTTLIGAIINVILDPIFIFVLDMGVRGAAIATVLSQAVGAIWVLRFLTGEKTILKLKLSNMKLDPKVFGPCLALGISSFVMISTESLLSISFTSSLSRYGGDVAVGAMTIITSVNQLITMPLQGICQGGQPIISYNFGAGNKDRVKKAFFTQFCVCATFTIAGWLVMMIAPWLFAGLFTSDTNLADYTSWALRIYMAGMFSMGFQVGCQQSFMALGQAKVSLLLACLRKIILLIPLIFILPCFLADKVFAVFLAEPISDILAATVTTITFFMRFDKILEVGVQVKKGD